MSCQRAAQLSGVTSARVIGLLVIPVLVQCANLTTSSSFGCKLITDISRRDVELLLQLDAVNAISSGGDLASLQLHLCKAPTSSDSSPLHIFLSYSSLPQSRRLHDIEGAYPEGGLSGTTDEVVQISPTEALEFNGIANEEPPEISRVATCMTKCQNLVRAEESMAQEEAAVEAEGEAVAEMEEHVEKTEEAMALEHEGIPAKEGYGEEAKVGDEAAEIATDGEAGEAAEGEGGFEEGAQAEAEGAEGEMEGEMEGEGEEGEEEEEEFHYTAVDVGVGGMLLFSVAFVLLLFYFVNYQDDDIRRYSWSIISTTVSIFTAVLVFHGINDLLMETLIDHGFQERGPWFVAVSYTIFIIWFSILHALVRSESYTLSSYAPANLLEETWSIANAMRWDYGMPTPIEYVRRPDAQKSISDLNNMEMFVQKIKGKVDQMIRRTVAVRILYSHIAGFACIHAGVAMQQTDLFSMNPVMAFLAVICNRLFLYCVFKATEPAEAEHVECALSSDEEEGSGKEHEDPRHVCAHLSKEELVEAQNDIASLSTSFLFVQAMRYGVTGVLPNGEGLEEPPIPISLQQQLYLYGLGVACMVVVIVLLQTGLATQFKFLGVLQNTLGMSLSWCFFWSSRWACSQNETLEKLRADPETMEGRILLALILTGGALSVIFVLDHVEDAHVETGNPGEEAQQISAVIQNFINALSILIGFSWEHCFDFALEGCASKTSNPDVAKLVFTGFVAMITIPMWRRHILVKVIQLNNMKEETDAATRKGNEKPKPKKKDSKSHGSSMASSEASFDASLKAASDASLRAASEKVSSWKASKDKSSSKEDIKPTNKAVSAEPDDDGGSSEGELILASSEEGE